MKRREVIRSLTVLPVAGALIGRSFPFDSALSAPAALPKRDLFKELGLRKFINAAGTFTFMTASLMPDEVIEAIASTSREFVLLDDVQDKWVKKLWLCVMPKQLQ